MVPFGPEVSSPSTNGPHIPYANSLAAAIGCCKVAGNTKLIKSSTLTENLSLIDLQAISRKKENFDTPRIRRSYFDKVIDNF